MLRVAELFTGLGVNKKASYICDKLTRQWINRLLRRDNKIRREYVLPDYALNKYGYIKGEESPPAGYDPKDEQVRSIWLKTMDFETHTLTDIGDEQWTHYSARNFI